MTIDSTVALLAFVATAVTAVFIRQQVRAMKQQTSQQSDIANQASWPYVWADIRASKTNPGAAEFVIGNSGRSVATNVKVRSSSPIPEFVGDDEPSLNERIAHGVSWIAPGRELVWPLGSAPEIFGDEPLAELLIEITANGPQGPIPPLTYTMRLADIRETSAAASGTLYQVRRSIDRLAKAVARE